MKNFPIILLLSFTLLSCSSETDDPNLNKFRNNLNNTFWIFEDGLLSFSPENLYYIYDSFDNSCYFYKEGMYNDVDYDGCTYNSVTFVIIEENESTLIFRQITSTGTLNNSGGTCKGDEVTIKFQLINENVLEASSISEIGTEVTTLTKNNNSFSLNSCINGTLNGR